MYPRGFKCLVFGILCTFIGFGQVRDCWIKLDPLGFLGIRVLGGYGNVAGTLLRVHSMELPK